jgi:fatty acid desaturase
MDALVEFLAVILDIIFHAVKSNQTNRSIKLIAYAIIFVVMCLAGYLSFVVRDDVITLGFFILLSGFLAVTLLRALPSIRRLITDKEA